MTNTIHKVSAGGVVYHQGKVLAIKWLSKNSIEFPKGTIEIGESKEEASIREVFEETGYNASILRSLDSITFGFDWDDDIHYRKTVHYFLMGLVNNDSPTPHREFNEDFENLWLTPEEAITMLTHDDGKEILSRAMGAICDIKNSKLIH
ncbi:MAG: NUDIX domain-containing protein [Candidatus Saccharimonadales bacterium]